MHFSHFPNDGLGGGLSDEVLTTGGLVAVILGGALVVVILGLALSKQTRLNCGSICRFLFFILVPNSHGVTNL